jgi:hypothetical protein
MAQIRACRGCDGRERFIGQTVQLATCTFVDAARQEGWPPEQIVRRVKELAAEAGLGMPRYRDFCASAGGGDDAVRALVTCCVDRYFVTTNQAQTRTLRC